jgi:hypothetical protein
MIRQICWLFSKLNLNVYLLVPSGSVAFFGCSTVMDFYGAETLRIHIERTSLDGTTLTADPCTKAPDQIQLGEGR